MNDFRNDSLASFLSQLAERSPAPGGGASAGVTVALAAAQAEMVVAWTTPALPDVIQNLQSVRAEALDLAVRDADAYGRWSLLRKERAENDPELQSAADEILLLRSCMAQICESNSQSISPWFVLQSTYPAGIYTSLTLA